MSQALAPISVLTGTRYAYLANLLTYLSGYLITVSLALATMAASSSSVISMARLNWVVSVVLRVAGRP